MVYVDPKTLTSRVSMLEFEIKTLKGRLERLEKLVGSEREDEN